MKKADYRHIALSYDQGRPLLEQNIDLWLGQVSRFAKMPEGARVLDLGCGTGRFSIPMAAKLRFRATGADSSKEMLDKAREKDTGKLVKWDLEDAQHLTYPDESFDVVFMSHLLHHVDDANKVLSECQRILATPGVILIRYGAIEQIREDIVHTFFPEALVIDEARTPTVAAVEQWLAEADFHDIVSEEIVQKTFETGEEHLNAAKLRGTSVLTMISQEAFEKGIRDLTKYIEDNPGNPWLLHDRETLTAGYKVSDRTQ